MEIVKKVIDYVYAALITIVTVGIVVIWVLV